MFCNQAVVAERSRASLSVALVHVQGRGFKPGWFIWAQNRGETSEDKKVVNMFQLCCSIIPTYYLVVYEYMICD